ncbi:site-specific integrase [Nocardioides sp. W3-2-3]|nr:site-specific integrase [Nocardioides convexus]
MPPSEACERARSRGCTATTSSRTSSGTRCTCSARAARRGSSRSPEISSSGFSRSRGGRSPTPGRATTSRRATSGFLLSKGLPEKWTAHTLRHRYATSVYAGTGDLFALMGLLGHSRPETTMRYTKVPGVRVRAAAAAASSLAA